MKVPSLALLLFLCGTPAFAGERVPSWLRLVDWDGQVFDWIGWQVDSLRLCPASEGTGEAVITVNGRPTVVNYAYLFYNDGGVTSDPDTTGDQIVLIEGADIVFGASFGDCVVFDR